MAILLLSSEAFCRFFMAQCLKARCQSCKLTNNHSSCPHGLRRCHPSVTAAVTPPQHGARCMPQSTLPSVPSCCLLPYSPTICAKLHNMAAAELPERAPTTPQACPSPAPCATMSTAQGVRHTQIKAESLISHGQQLHAHLPPPSNPYHAIQRRKNPASRCHAQRLHHCSHASQHCRPGQGMADRKTASKGRHCVSAHMQKHTAAPHTQRTLDHRQGRANNATIEQAVGIHRPPTLVAQTPQ